MKVLVTGTSKGIGKSIATKFLEEGHDVIGFDIQKSSINNKNYTHYIQDICGELPDIADIDILVNNAGITRDGLIMKMKEEDFDSVLDTNLKGCFNMMRHLSRHFLKLKSGKIVNISSVSGLLGNAGQANYSASKAGVIGLTKAVAKELASRGINVNAVAPGFVETEMTDVLSDDAKEALLSNVPLNRPGQTTDIANAVLFLASGMSDYITGQVLAVDGGMS